jgi:hypothetical protein
MVKKQVVLKMMSEINIPICHLCKGKLGRVCQFYKGHFYCLGCRSAMLKQVNPQKSLMEFK